MSWSVCLKRAGSYSFMLLSEHLFTLLGERDKGVEGRREGLSGKAGARELKSKGLEGLFSDPHLTYTLVSD